MPYYSPSTRGFYTKQVHGADIPADAVEITTLRHEQLMLAQAQGHDIVHTPAGLVAKHPHDDREELLAHTRGLVKSEARRRILAIASLAQQSNDNAALALRALKLIKGDSTEFVGAQERRHKINAVREASNRIEAGLAGHTDGELKSFTAALAAWPKF